MDLTQTSLESLAERIAALGVEIGLPEVATWADLASTRPVMDADGHPLPLHFRFTPTENDYWRQPDLALRNAVVTLVRHLAEPFYFSDGEVGSWRPLNLDPGLARKLHETGSSVRRSIVAPVHLPRSVIGAVVWATDQMDLDVRSVFERHAPRLQAEAIRFIAACNEAAHGAEPLAAISLTRREIQCLKLIAAGKSDGEIAQIMTLSIPTVRFHLRNSGTKLARNGRLRIVQRAASLGFVSIR